MFFDIIKEKGGILLMYQYKVITLTSLKELESSINEYANKGWKVISIFPHIKWVHYIVVTLEKEI